MGRSNSTAAAGQDQDEERIGLDWFLYQIPGYARLERAECLMAGGVYGLTRPTMVTGTELTSVEAVNKSILNDRACVIYRCEAPPDDWLLAMPKPFCQCLVVARHC